MKFLKLTDNDGDPCLVNIAHITAVLSDEDGCYLRGPDINLHVKEKFHVIDKWISDHEISTRTKHTAR
jgi:hypothetical protein